jgi:hypothetical protein
MRFLYVLSLVFLSGCALFAKHDARLNVMLSPKTLGSAISVQQHLQVIRDKDVKQLDAVLEVDAQHLTLIGLAVGQRMFTLDYDGKQLHTWRHPLLPAMIRGEDILRDIQLTLWPIAEITKALPVGWTMIEKKRIRILLQKNIPVMEIYYSGDSRWQGQIHLKNNQYHYQLIIDSQIMEPA